jgi:hypothetical protein
LSLPTRRQPPHPSRGRFQLTASRRIRVKPALDLQPVAASESLSLHTSRQSLQLRRRRPPGAISLPPKPSPVPPHCRRCPALDLPRAPPPSPGPAPDAPPASVSESSLHYSINSATIVRCAWFLGLMARFRTRTDSRAPSSIPTPPRRLPAFPDIQ